MSEHSPQWIDASRQTAHSYCRMLDAAVSQLTDEELRRRPAEGVNSVAVILRHLGGNLRSRWTDFLESDGEKPDRNRETEFADWDGDRETLLAYFHDGWSCLTDAIERIDHERLKGNLLIRGESHTIQEALLRSLTHVSYHVGQIMMIARLVHDGDWNWLTIAPGQSQLHNEQTWGTPQSRSGLGKVDDDPI